MCSQKTKPTTIQLTPETKACLTKLKHRGQSYEGFLLELIDFWKKAHPPNEARRGEK